MTTGEHDVVVVGSGHNALIAAAHLRVSGLNVLVPRRPLFRSRLQRLPS